MTFGVGVTVGNVGGFPVGLGEGVTTNGDGGIVGCMVIGAVVETGVAATVAESISDCVGRLVFPI